MAAGIRAVARHPLASAGRWWADRQKRKKVENLFKLLGNIEGDRYLGRRAAQAASKRNTVTLSFGK